MPTLLNKKSSPSALRRPAAPALIFGDLWNYDPAPETAEPKLKSRYELFIGGKFVAPASGEYFDSINPANEQKLAEIARANAADVAAAYRAAKKLTTKLGAGYLVGNALNISSVLPGCSRIGRANLR